MPHCWKSHVAAHLFENKKRFIVHNFRTFTVSLITALGGTADVESIQAMMEEEDQKEKGFLEVLGKKMKDEGVSRPVYFKKTPLEGEGGV